MQWRLLCSLCAIGAISFSISTPAFTAAQDGSDPIAEALGGSSPFSTTAATQAQESSDTPLDPVVESPTEWIDPPAVADAWLQAHANAQQNQDFWTEQAWPGVAREADPFAGDDRVDSWANLRTLYGSTSNTVELTATIEGDRVQVTLNGQPVPADRLERRGDTVTVRDGSGRSVATITMSGDGRVTIPQGFSFRGPAEWTKQATQRRVIGVRTGSLDPALARHLQLAAGEGILVTSVIDGQPAARAGLEAHDVIVSINGSRPANLPALRTALSTVDENGTVRLTIVRAGRTLDLDCGVTSVSTSSVNSTTLPGGGNFTLSTKGDAPTSLYWHRLNLGMDANPSSQEIQSFPSGITALSGTNLGSGGNIIVDRNGRPLSIGAQAEPSRNTIITQGQSSGKAYTGLTGVVRGQSSGSQSSGRANSTGQTVGTGGGINTTGLNFFAPGEKDKLDERTKAIEERLERLEKLLEQLVDQKNRDAQASIENDRTGLPQSNREGAPIETFLESLFASF